MGITTAPAPYSAICCVRDALDPSFGSAHTNAPHPVNLFPPTGGNVMNQPVVLEKKFNEMGIGEKLAFCVKLSLFLVSFGFAFPTLLSD
jgi:hypothetical protein